MVADDLPDRSDTDRGGNKGLMNKSGAFYVEITIGRKGQDGSVPALFFPGNPKNERLVIWVHPEGRASLWKDDKLVPAAKAINDRGAHILVIDAFRTGQSAKEPRPKMNTDFHFGYNRAIVAERVRDILTVIGHFYRDDDIPSFLVGFEEAGPWVLLARGLCGDKIARTAVDLNGFRFDRVKDFDDEMMLPGALRYGGLPGLAATIAPHELFIHNAKSTSTGGNSVLQAAYRASGEPEHLKRQDDKADPVEVVRWLLR
jgi:hypothetical protein